MKNAGRKKYSSFQLAAGAAVFGLVWITGFAPAQAAAQGTPEQQQACTPDAMRLCSEFVPDVTKISACMNRKRAELSPACRATMVTPHKRTTHHHH